MRKRLEAYTMATELKNVARPQPESGRNKANPGEKIMPSEVEQPAAKIASVGIATEPRFTASVLRLTTK